MKIMVADDYRDMVDMLSYWLKGHGYDVVRAFDGEQALGARGERLELIDLVGAGLLTGENLLALGPHRLPVHPGILADPNFEEAVLAVVHRRVGDSQR